MGLTEVKQCLKLWLQRSKLGGQLLRDYQIMAGYCYMLRYCKTHNQTNEDYKPEILQALKGKYKGQRCFIVGAGPSLTLEQLEMIKEEYSFGVNADFTLYDKTAWRATSYCMIDDSCIQKYQDKINEDEIEYFFYGAWSKYYGKKGICVPIHNAHNHIIGSRWNRWFPRAFPVCRFSNDISKIVYTGKSVVYTLLQIAAYMGFTEIYLLGVDCNYMPQALYNQNIRHTDNIPDVQKYENGKQMIVQYEVAQKWAIKNNIGIYNATGGGQLEAFPRVNLSEVLQREN